MADASCIASLFRLVDSVSLLERWAAFLFKSMESALQATTCAGTQLLDMPNHKKVFCKRVVENMHT